MTRIESINTSLLESSTGNASITFLEYEYLDAEYEEWNESSTDNATNTFLYEEFENLRWLDFVDRVRIIVPIVFGIITVTGIVGNILTVAVVLRHKGIKSITDILIINLAVADLIYIGFCIPYRIVLTLMSVSPFGNVMCRILTYFYYVSPYASVYILVLMALDRHLALVHPMMALSLRTKRNCYIILTIIWSIIVIGNMPLIFDAPFCPDVKQSPVQMLYITFFVFGFMLPVTVMSVLYVYILKTFHTGNNPSVNNSTSRVRLQSKQRVTKMVITVVMVFIIFWLPNHILSLCLAYNIYFYNSIVFHSVSFVADSLAYLNSCINPMLYSFYSKSFRKEFMDLLKCKRRT